MTAQRQLLLGLFEAAIAAADPARILPAYLPSPPSGRTLVIGAGKAAASMAHAFEEHWPGPLQGLVVTRYGHGAPCRRIEVVEAGHPEPDAAGRGAAARILAMVTAMGEDDLVVALISGGGSALLCLPPVGMRLEEMQAINRALLRSGAKISEINTVRKHLSAIMGGRLAVAAFPARLEALLISDVPGDDPSVIASGPTVADPSSAADAEAVLARYRIEVSAATRCRLRDEAIETPKPGDPRLARAAARLIATPHRSLEAAAAAARSAGVRPLILGDAIEGESAEVGRVLAGIARSVARHGQPIAPPAVLLSGGATSVTVRGDGRGGRNVELALGLALALESAPGIWALAGDTDGIDGAEDVAGAIVTPDTLFRARHLDLDARRCLARNDSHSFFEMLGDRVVTGPTLTNVNDFRAVLILGGSGQNGDAERPTPLR